MDGEPKITHSSKIFWPKEGITKGDLINYYDSVAETILPYLAERPESLNRHPDGITGKNFYQKDLEEHPAWVTTKAIHSEANKKDISWLVANDRRTLLYMINLGCIELNPWLSRAGQLDKPDWCLIDLDAKTAKFEIVIQVALELKRLLDELGLPSYPKTSGKTGLHVAIPLGAKYSYDQSRTLAEIVVRQLQERLPDITSVERDPDKRKGKIYLDYLQNRQGQTMAAAYSVRPVAGAPVSTPLDWSEVKAGLEPKKFTIKNTQQRIKRVGDLWAPVLGKGVRLEKVLAKIS